MNDTLEESEKSLFPLLPLTLALRYVRMQHAVPKLAASSHLARKLLVGHSQMQPLYLASASPAIVGARDAWMRMTQVDMY